MKQIYLFNIGTKGTHKEQWYTPKAQFELIEYSSIEECTAALNIPTPEKDNDGVFRYAPEFRVDEVYVADSVLEWANSDFHFKHPHGDVVHRSYKHINKARNVYKDEVINFPPYGNGIEYVKQPETRMAIIGRFHVREEFISPLPDNLKYEEHLLGCSCWVSITLGYLK